MSHHIESVPPAGRGSVARAERDPVLVPWKGWAASILTLLAAWMVCVPADRGAMVALLGWSGAPAGTERARVIEVVDGDTIVLEDGRTVRLLGIDAPESVHPDMDGPQPFGLEAAARLRELVDDRVVHLERDVTDTDHYGRSLRYVWRGGTLVSEVLIREGLARAQPIAPDRRHAGRHRAAEDRARAAGTGLWGIPRPTPLPIFAAPP